MKKFVIGIGAPKTSTTWLGNYFSNHPDICFSPRKEIHYFDAKHLDVYSNFEDKIINNYKKFIQKINKKSLTIKKIERLTYLNYRTAMIKDPNAYLGYFNSFYKNEKYCSEFTTTYSMMDKSGFVKMKELLGDVKIIFLMRNPIDRHWSHLKFKNLKVSRINHNEIFEKSFEIDNFYKAGEYIQALTNIYEVFDKQDVLILFYEHLFDKANQQAYFSKLIKFLDIKNIAPSFSERENSSTSDSLGDKRRKFGIQKLQNIYEYVIENFDDVPNSWKQDLELIKAK